MNVIRDIFSILFILCVLCWQFDSVQVQASQNDQMRVISSVSPQPDKPHASSFVTAPQLQEREFNLSVTLTTTKNEIDGRRDIARKKKSKKLHNRLKDSNHTVSLSTTKTEIEGSKKITRKRKSEKLLNKHKESNRKDTLNTTKTEVKKKRDGAKKRKSKKLRHQDKESSSKASPNTTRKDIEERAESASKSESKKLLNHRESNSKARLNTTRKDVEGRAESARKSKSEMLLNYRESNSIASLNTTRKDIEERAESARKSESEMLLNHRESNSKASLNTTRKDVEGRAESARKSEGEKLLNHRESHSKATPNTQWKYIEERAESARKIEGEKLLNHRESHSKASPNTTWKDIEERAESARKSESEKLLNHRESNSKASLNTTRKDIEERAESARKSESEMLLKYRKPSGEEGADTIIKISEDSGENTRKRKSQELLYHDFETTSPWPKKRINSNRRHKSIGRSPVVMRQQEKDVKKSKEEEEDVVPEVLNVYSLREDMMRMLSSIPNINASVGVIGRTAEYNDIVLCKITEYSKTKKPKKLRTKPVDDKYTDEEAEKKIIFIVHGLSAMGFNEVPCLNEEKQFIKLLKFYTEHLDKFDIYLIPIANPDGVSGHESLSNKNKSPQTSCSGVALDRNFDVSWNAFHVNSCHQQYPGPTAFSEPEARAVGDILHQFNNRITAYINVHAGSYSADVFKGDAVLYPKGFVEFNSDDDKYMDIKGEIDEALRVAGFKVMSVTVDTLYNWYGKVTGTSVDYASSVYGIPYALEFVMQPYQDSPSAASTERTSENVLTEIWKRLIDVVFTNIHRNNQNNEVNK